MFLDSLIISFWSPLTLTGHGAMTNMKNSRDIWECLELAKSWECLELANPGEI